MFLKSVITAAILATGLAAASAQSINAPAGTYESDKTHTNLLWSVKHFGLSNYYGRFDSIYAQLDLDPENPARSKLNVTIDPKSVDTNYPAKPNTFNAEIAGGKFLDAEKFDKITFTSTEIKVTGKNTGKVTGNLTFHGVTKPVTLDVTFNGALNPHPMARKPVIGFSARGTLKRSDFGVNVLLQYISDDVSLIIETELVQK